MLPNNLEDHVPRDDENFLSRDVLGPQTQLEVGHGTKSKGGKYKFIAM